jgi:hypothetical protein
MSIIDCHAHIYSPDEKRWLPSGKGSVEDVRKESLANGVRAARAIQTLTFYDVDLEPCVLANLYTRIFIHALGLSEEAKRRTLGETARKIWFPPEGLT